MDPFVEDVIEFANSDTFGPILRRILAYEDKVLAEGGWNKPGAWDGRPMGWEWFEVQVAPGYLMKLVNAGIISVVHKSNKHTDYRLTDPELVRKALLGQLAPRSEEGRTPEEDRLIAVWKDFFEPIVGYEDVKDLLRRALAAPRPVHVALEGPPASAKSLFLLRLERLPGAFMTLGGTASKAGLAEVLLEAQPAVLLIDELDKMDRDDFSVLLSLCETGRVSGK